MRTKTAFREIVERGPPPGLLAFRWRYRCALVSADTAGRAAVAGSRVAAQAGGRCGGLVALLFYVRKGYRRKGVTETLIGAALNAARCAKVPALEAYPLDAELTPSASSTGYASTFSRAGFKTVARRVPPRPIMRYDLARNWREKG